MNNFVEGVGCDMKNKVSVFSASSSSSHRRDHAFFLCECIVRATCVVLKCDDLGSSENGNSGINTI